MKTSASMWLPQQQLLLTDLVQQALVRLCLEHVPFDNRLELDGLVCINSDIGGSRQVVVKIHTVVGPKVRIDDPCGIKLATERNAFPSEKSATPISSSFSNNNSAMPRSNGIVRATDLSSRPSSTTVDEPIALISESREESVDIPRPVLAAVASAGLDESMPLWTQRAPQILKLLTKSEFPGGRVQQHMCMTPTDLSKTGTASSAGSLNNGQDKASSTVKSEPAISHDDRHARDVSGIEPSSSSLSKWRCKVCHTQFLSFTDLEVHMRTQHVRFVCRICLNSFTLSCNLRRHMKLHAGVRPHSCLYCPASFSRSTDLKIHMKKHPDAAAIQHLDRSKSASESTTPSKSGILHECDVCGKGFATVSHLAEHQRTHVDNENDSTGTENMASDGEPSGADSDDMPGNAWSSNGPTDLSVSSSSVNGVFVVQPDASEERMEDGCLDLSDTMREYAPFLQPPGSSLLKSASSPAPAHDAAVGPAKTSTPLRSKRKGMPIKHVEVNESGDVDNNEMMMVDSDIPTTDNSGPKPPAVVCTNDNATLPESVLNLEMTDEQTPTEISSGPTTTAVDTLNNTNELDCSSEFSGTDLQTKTFQCQYAGGCSVSCVGFAAYEAHYVSAHGGRYPCALCPQSFTSRNNRRRHADGHEGAAGHGRHQCASCGKRFARADIIKEHRLTHTRSYRLGTCSKCGEVCGAKKSFLLLHLKRCMAYIDIDNDIEEVVVDGERKPATELVVTEVAGDAV